MLLNPFTVLINNNDARPITAELIESKIPQKHEYILLLFFTVFTMQLTKQQRVFLVTTWIYNPKVIK